MPGILISAIRQAGQGRSPEPRKFSAESNTDAAKPWDSNMRCKASRTALSSSTIAINGPIGARPAFAYERRYSGRGCPIDRSCGHKASNKETEPSLLGEIGRAHV